MRPSLAVALSSAIRHAQVSDAQRSSTMAVFRVLLNVLVIAVLLLASHLPEAYIFGLAVVMLGICLACVIMLQPSTSAGRVGVRDAELARSEDPLLRSQVESALSVSDVTDSVTTEPSSLIDRAATRGDSTTTDDSE